MFQAKDGARLVAKLLDFLRCQLRGQHFDGGQSLHVNMLAQVDLGETAVAKQSDELIVAELVAQVASLVIGYKLIPLCNRNSWLCLSKIVRERSAHVKRVFWCGVHKICA